MKAFILDRYGSADGVWAGDMPDPELRAFAVRSNVDRRIAN
jgi:hypothetical protein